MPETPGLKNGQDQVAHSHLDSHEAKHFNVDDAVLSLLPQGTVIVSVENHGSSEWTQSFCITGKNPGGDLKKYFLKVAAGSDGKSMLCGEYTALATIQSCVPGLVPNVLGWGKTGAAESELYFLLEQFREMKFDLPDTSRLAKRVVDLHSNGSPNGMFGFDVPTFNGKVNHITDWEPSWAVFFTRFLRNTIKIDEQVNGHWPELARAAVHLLEHVTPRLLGGLQLAPTPIRPSLIHGDLWAGNIGTDKESGEILFFDTGSYFAHNEMELGMWRRTEPRYLGPRYVPEYLILRGPSEPASEFDDRNRLYCLHYRLNYSIGHPGDIERRNALNDIAFLCEKYAPFESGLVQYDRNKDPRPSILETDHT